MYRPYFEAAADFLESLGISCAIYDGRGLNKSEWEELSRLLSAHIPDDLAEYWRELGDGFSIQWETPSSGDLISFGLSSLEDILQEYSWLQQQLQEVCDAQSLGDEIAQEARLRQGWIPIMGIGEGGYEFCLDTKDGSICYYESHWKDHSSVWRSCLAPSLRGLVSNWSRYCFSEPVLGGANVSMSIFAGRIEGQFDWAPSCFDPRFDREKMT